MLDAAIQRPWALAILWVAAACGPLPAARAVDALTVETHTGRVFHGQLDARTTAAQLVLRNGSPGLLLRRPIPWEAIARLRLAGQEFTPQQALAALEAQGWSSPAEELPLPPPLTTDAPHQQPSPGAIAARVVFEQPALTVVRSLYVEATVARWTGGVENDGILLQVMPLDELGTIVPASGSLEVELIGEQGARLRSGEPFPRLARWVQQVHPQDFGAYGAAYRLAYQAWHPEFDLRLGSQAVVHARLSAPGHGVFDATATMVQIRPFDTSRDRLQKYTGRRFFPVERTSRGTNDSGVFQP